LVPRKTTLPKKAPVTAHPKKPVPWGDYLVKFGFYAGMVGIWELVCLAQIWPPYILPSPVSVALALYRGFEDKTLLLGVGVSMERLIIGYSISVIIGVTLGLLLGRVRYLEKSLGSALLGIQTLPSICWVPVATLWFGFGRVAITFVVVIGSLFVIAISTQDGVRHVPPLFIKNARLLGIKGWRLYWEIILPSALPAIVTGMKLGWSFAWRSLMGGELLFADFGLGHLLKQGRDVTDTSLVFAVMVVIVAIGLLVDHLIFAVIESGIKKRRGLLAEEH
jgi:NitT/TauT family transport system permease protein